MLKVDKSSSSKQVRKLVLAKIFKEFKTKKDPDLHRDLSV